MTAYNRDGIKTPQLGLGQVFFDLGPEWETEEERLAGRLAEEGITALHLSSEEDPAATGFGTIVLTDNPSTVKRFALTKAVCFGCGHASDSWFPGTALVLESLEGIDGRYLEEWMLRVQGLPAGIAQTEHLVLREIAELDVKRLAQIARQCGPDVFSEEGLFTEENLPAYAKTAYRLQGFGLWTVLLQGMVIGCCGFAPFQDCNEENSLQYRLLFPSAKMKEPGERTVLELQYFLDPACQRRGYGTEMCRAALKYARERLSADEIRIRIYNGNRASEALAEKLAFCRVS